jgi:hypothetical protein
LKKEKLNNFNLESPSNIYSKLTQLKEKSFNINFASSNSFLVSNGKIKQENFIDECFVSLNNIINENPAEIYNINKNPNVNIKDDIGLNNENNFASNYDFKKNLNMKTGKLLFC